MMTQENPRQYEPAEGSRDIIDVALNNSHISEATEVQLLPKNVGSVERVLSAALGVKLLMVAVKKLGFGGLLASGVAITMFTRASTGRCAIKEQLKELSV